MSLITIEQLLESVDLDFEPRWVTKDKSGEICIWKCCRKPEPDEEMWDGPIEGDYECFGKIKLAEFAVKDWQNCIYEVPRKTTGKVKKIVIENDRCGNVEWWDVVNKINELVDAVNKHADIIQQIGQWGSSKGKFLWCETLTKFEPKELKGAKNE